MPEARPPRASKRELRAWAWIAGGLAFLAPAAVLGAAPEPPETARPGADVVVRKITRRIVIVESAAPAPVRYIPSTASPGASSTSASSGSALTTSTGGS